MESISKILDAIAAEGKREAEKIAENSAHSCAEIAKLYEKEALADKESILKKAEKKAAEIQQRSVSQAGIESRNIKLSARRGMLEKAFTVALERLAAMGEDEKKALYEKLITKYSGESDITIKVNAADQELAKKLTVDNKNITIDETAGDFSGGLIIKEKLTETNCTFDVIVENAKKDMEAEIASVLFA